MNKAEYSRAVAKAINSPIFYEGEGDARYQNFLRCDALGNACNAVESPEELRPDMRKLFEEAVKAFDAAMA